MTDIPTHIPTTCPWCSSENAQIENPDFTSDRFLLGTCPDCERAFEEDQYQEYFDDLDE
jgi:transposase-like protein